MSCGENRVLEFLISRGEVAPPAVLLTLPAHQKLKKRHNLDNFWRRVLKFCTHVYSKIVLDWKKTGGVTEGGYPSNLRPLIENAISLTLFAQSAEIMYR